MVLIKNKMYKAVYTREHKACPQTTTAGLNP